MSITTKSGLGGKDAGGNRGDDDDGLEAALGNRFLQMTEVL